MLVHAPVTLAVLLPALCFGVLAAWRAGKLDREAWWIVVSVEVVTAAGAAAAVISGERDAELVSRYVAAAALELHEARAQIFVWTALGVAVLSAVVPWLREERDARLVALAVGIGSVVVATLGASTAVVGGELVYRHGAAQAHPGYRGASGAVGPP